MLWHSLLEIAVYLVVLVLVLVQLEQSQRATANLKSMQITAFHVVPVLVLALQEQFLKSNFTQNEKLPHMLTCGSFYYAYFGFGGTTNENIILYIIILPQLPKGALG